LRIWRSLSRSEKTLLLLFLLSLPFVHPQIRSDGIGYYAYARSLIVDHNLCFSSDWKTQDETPFRITGFQNGQAVRSFSTSTGHIPNLYAVGPAILWSPFLAATHAAVLLLNNFGAHIAADGHSRPYRITIALSTVFYGFLGLWLSFQLARKYFGERWAFWATVGIWFASSLPVYMYEEPAWSHAHSAFAVSLFLWYWDKTREDRSTRQWIILGLISGLMCEVYFANGVFLVVPLLESFAHFYRAWSAGTLKAGESVRLLRSYLLFAAGAIVAFLPQLIVRKIIFGTPFALGLYGERSWDFLSPHFWDVLFSSNRGALLWTPILIPSVIGLFFLPRRAPAIAASVLAAALCFYLLICVDPWWNGAESFGIRFFVSLTPIFVLGLAAACERFAGIWSDAQAGARRIAVIFLLLIAWNLGLILQIRYNLLPIFGQVEWRDVVYAQFRVVPGMVLDSLRSCRK
jgi:hypothetical protein